MTDPLIPSLRALAQELRERDKKLTHKADTQPSLVYAKTLADRAECYGYCADKIDALLSAHEGRDTR